MTKTEIRTEAQNAGWSHMNGMVEGRLARNGRGGGVMFIRSTKVNGRTVGCLNYWKPVKGTRNVEMTSTRNEQAIRRLIKNGPPRI